MYRERQNWTFSLVALEDRDLKSNNSLMQWMDEKIMQPARKTPWGITLWSPTAATLQGHHAHLPSGPSACLVFVYIPPFTRNYHLQISSWSFGLPTSPEYHTICYLQKNLPALTAGAGVLLVGHFTYHWDRKTRVQPFWKRTRERRWAK